VIDFGLTLVSANPWDHTAELLVTGGMERSPGRFSLDRFIQGSQAVGDFPVAKG
jgi:hypothetical protein